MMPNRYLPSALTEIAEERQQEMQKESDDYVAEWEAYVSLLTDDVQEEFRQRRGE